MAQEIKHILFDLGGVLVDWDPNYLYTKLIPDQEERKWFLEQVCSLDWNEQQDGGRTIEEGIKVLSALYPGYADLIFAYYDRWEEMLRGPIEGTVAIFSALKKNKNVGLYALTNWSAETFPRALEIFDFLHCFDGRVVSGEEKTRKPFNEIYEIFLKRYSLSANQTLFIDDNSRNILAAEKLGFTCHHFTDPDALFASLKKFGLL